MRRIDYYKARIAKRIICCMANLTKFVQERYTATDHSWPHCKGGSGVELLEEKDISQSPNKGATGQDRKNRPHRHSKEQASVARQ